VSSLDDLEFFLNMFLIFFIVSYGYAQSKVESQKNTELQEDTNALYMHSIDTDIEMITRYPLPIVTTGITQLCVYPRWKNIKYFAKLVDFVRYSPQLTLPDSRLELPA